MTTLEQVRLGVLGPMQVRQDGLPVVIPGAKPRAILTMLGLHYGSVVAADTLVELLWGDDPPRTAVKALQTHVSALRRALGDGFVLTEGTGWTLGTTTKSDATLYATAARVGRHAAATGDASAAVARFDEAVTLWRGAPELPTSARGGSERTRWIEGHAALVEDRADALLATGRAAELVGELEAAIADAPLRERRWGQLMLALYRAGRQGEALGAYRRARALLADQLGVDPGPDLRRLEAAIVAQDVALALPVPQHSSSMMRAVTFLLTDIEGSTVAWEADAGAMAVALARHDEIVEQVVTFRGGRLIKTRGEGDATFSVFDRPSAAAAAAIELQEAIRNERWELADPMRIRLALHTGEVEFRDGDYFGRAVNRAARLRSLAVGGQTLCSGATAELVVDSLSDDVVLADLGMRLLKNLTRPEHVFELRLETADDALARTMDVPLDRPDLPAVLAGPGPFVGRDGELERLLEAWHSTLSTGIEATLIAGEPGVGKTRLAAEWARQAYGQGAVVLYGRCDEDLGAPYQPFAEAIRSLVPVVGANRLRGLRGVEALLPLVPGVTDLLPDLATPTRADAGTERYALFDAVVGLLELVSANAPVVLILDDLHWAAKPTLLLLRHLLRFGEHARVQIVGTYRSTDLDRSHPLAAMLADLHRDGTAHRLALGGLDEDDVTAYVAEVGYDDEDLARALASVTGGNPFFLIEALRHVDESDGRWDPNTLPQGVREAVSRRLSRLPAATNKALAAGAVVGSRFAVELVERVVEQDLIDAFDEASQAGIVIEEPGGWYRFNHAIVRQSLLAELASVRRMRLHQKIAAALEAESGADDEMLAELAHHYFECAWAGNAAEAVDYCRRAADQAMARLAYEGAADLYDKALHALEELDDEVADRGDQQAELLIARCEALLAGGEVASATGAVAQLISAAADSVRLAAWGACFDGQLAMLTEPERLNEIEVAVGAAAEQLAELEDAGGEAKAHTVRAGCLARLGRIADCETALDQALTAARRARDHRRVNAVLAGAPLAALWGPSPVPRAGGRCLDVVRLLRITTGSPIVEATSIRCQGVLDAFRGRAAAGRQLIDSARRPLTELGMRHALLEVDQFAGIVELVADDPAAAERHLRRAYKGFRRMGLDSDTAETAALLAQACMALDDFVEADELCTESEQLAGHALKPSIAWRSVRAQLFARAGAHDDARRMAEQAVAIAERTDELVDHGDACLALAVVLETAGDAAGARAAAERAVELYDMKDAAALANRARRLLGKAAVAAVPKPQAPESVDLDNACVRAVGRVGDAWQREAWDEVGQLFASTVSLESRRKIVGSSRMGLSPAEWTIQAKGFVEMGLVRIRRVTIAIRGDRLALFRMRFGTADRSPGAAEDQLLHLMGLDDDGQIALHMLFDVEDLDAAMAELNTQHGKRENCSARAPLENAASRASQRYLEKFQAAEGDSMTAIVAANYAVNDRRRIVNAVMRAGRDAQIENFRVTARAGAHLTSTVVATRGEHLALTRIESSNGDVQVGQFELVMLGIVELDADEFIAFHLLFDPDDFNGAIAELDARYLAGEAADHSQAWSLVMDVYSAFNRAELPPIAPDFVSVDHRRGAGFAPGELSAYPQAAWEDSPGTMIHVEAVHRLSDHGAVVTRAANGVSREGFDAEWRDVSVGMIDGGVLTRTELFDLDDLEAALARFDELSQPSPRLQNAASDSYERFATCFERGHWDQIVDMIAADVYSDDRRRTVNGGTRLGRDAFVDELRSLAEIGFVAIAPEIVATRGERLVLIRAEAMQSDQRSDGFDVQVLDVVQIDADERVVGRIVFDADGLDAAFTELDNRYLAGLGAPHARTYSVVAHGFDALNRGEMPNTTAGFVDVDHRSVAGIGAGDLLAYLGTALHDTADNHLYVESVHELTDVGAVVTHVAKGTSREGFDFEWRLIDLLVVDGESFARCELFDEEDIVLALARLAELSRPSPRLENAASRAGEALGTAFVACDWKALECLLHQNLINEDRRRVINAGVRHGRDAEIDDLRASAAVGFTMVAWSVIATRGEHLALSRARYARAGEHSMAFHNDVLHIVEVNADMSITSIIVFDPDGIDAAIAELDSRYLTGEAAACAHTWSLVVQTYDRFNRQELSTTTPDWVNLDHRLAVGSAPGDMNSSVTSIWSLVPDVRTRIEAVYRLSAIGAVFTHTESGRSQDGFDAEWREVALLAFDGDAISRCELFDESDLDLALARFDELSAATPRPVNAAARTTERFVRCFATGDWDALTETLGSDFNLDDRRRVVGAGIRRGRDAEIEDLRAFTAVGLTNATFTVLATRGERLVLSRTTLRRGDSRSDGVHTDMFSIAEVDADGRMIATVLFDPDDPDAAIAELDARYLAGEAAPYERTWSTIARNYSAFNRQEFPPTTPDWVTIDHRRTTSVESDDLPEYIRSVWDDLADFTVYIENVHQVSELGAVFTQTESGRSRDGFDAEWREVALLVFDGDAISRCELFDESDLDVALARFDELTAD
ncbi:BTAD domain-containing putative transcriptional regulator [Mycolicibacterium hodleri]|uniref:ATPase n=1 Tax=Mycolicibacterium hodleri TaxID=49897 RepID=A0A502E529_9MYCO|nr:BTAD domain-containing putative transcriptional regulator [Mycolicibacterium hodleri]TPG32059.1 hypothetical protein EAH80_21870 [Mycolicibacterium hodleri]